MSYLNELIQNLCPNGVVYKPLCKLLKYEQPTKYIVQSVDYKDNYATPVLTAGQTFILGYTNECTGIYTAFKERPVIIFDDFTTSFHWVDFPFKVKSSAMKILTPYDTVNINFKYIYYAMKTIDYTPSTHTRQWIATYSKFEIPIPPLKIQQEIVRMLDTFVDLIDSLKKELPLREKQYAYYRKSLINFDRLNI